MKEYDLPLKAPEPNAADFCRIIRRKIVPSSPPFAELIIDPAIIRELSVKHLGTRWVEPEDGESQKVFWDNFIDFHYRFGYDWVRIVGGVDFETKSRVSGERSWTEEGRGVIASREDFEKYPWPKLEDVQTWHYEYVSKRLPAGMGLFVCPSSGFLEIPLSTLMGYETLSYAVYDDPGLVKDVFDRVGGIIYGFYEKLIGLENLYGFFQGDDMGFKTGTLMSPDFLREHIFPWHKKLARLAHDNGLVYLLHSCRLQQRHSFFETQPGF